MTRQAFRDALTDLRTAVLELGDLVLDRLEAALTALADGDDELAQTVIDAWALERLIDDVASVLLTIRDLERLGLQSAATGTNLAD